MIEVIELVGGELGERCDGCFAGAVLKTGNHVACVTPLHSPGAQDDGYLLLCPACVEELRDLLTAWCWSHQ